ncbi:hypothetical protein [Brevinema andersonii]|uniref:hypothetical protein n=1 Tax=Brevinema andersonii TaxID=34097 RepID=UPI0013563BEF|nr:hypothetical protein [Brevinema andersonii]
MVYKPSQGGGHSDINNPGGKTIKHVRLVIMCWIIIEMETAQGSGISDEKFSLILH